MFENRRLVVNDWPSRDVLKWPTFESDSQTVIYQSTVPGDMCCRGNLDGSGNSRWTKYGYMGPTNYYEDPGRLWSVDTKSAAPTPVPLARLNTGERPTDANKSYQPSVLPAAAGGYRWVVFTSTRPCNSTINRRRSKGLQQHRDVPDGELHADDELVGHPEPALGIRRG